MRRRADSCGVFLFELFWSSVFYTFMGGVGVAEGSAQCEDDPTWQNSFIQTHLLRKNEDILGTYVEMCVMNAVS